MLPYLIRLKDKIDEKVFSDILIKEGLTKISIEIKNSEKSDIYNFFKFEDEVNITDIAPINIIGLDAKNSCLYINIQTIPDILKEIGGGLTKGYFGSIPNDIKKANNIENSGDKLGKQFIKEGFITSIKKILFREKILDEAYDKPGKYKNHPEKYEANTDDIIEKIEKIEKENTKASNSIGTVRANSIESSFNSIGAVFGLFTEPYNSFKEKTEPYNLFIIKHFIKYIMDKYKEAKATEDNSAKEDTEDIISNPFITDIEEKE